MSFVNSIKNNAWIVCFSAGLFFFYEFIQMSVFNAIGVSILKDFSISSAGLASIAAAYSYGMVLFLLPAGILLDLFSIKKIMLSAFLLSVFGTLLFSFSKNLVVAECCRMISGVGGAFAFLSCIKLATRWFPLSKMSFVVGLIITLAFLGGAVAQTPFTFLVEKLGWHITLRILATFGLIFIFCILFFVKDNPTCFVKMQKKSEPPFFRRVSFSLKNSQTWVGASYIMLMNLPIVLLGALWGDLYLTEAKNFTHAQASYIDTMLFIGIMIGSPVFGFLSDKLKKRKSPLILGAFLTLGSSLLLFLHFSSIAIYVGIFFLLGVFSSAQGVAYPLIVENNIGSISGTVSGIASIIIMGGGALFKILYGWMLDLHWNGAKLNDVPFYSHQAFKSAMVLLPVSFLIAFFISIYIKETYCQRID